MRIEVPDGWQLVPIDPPEDLLAAGNEASLSVDVLMDDTRFACPRAMWKAMLERARKQPIPEGFAPAP